MSNAETIKTIAESLSKRKEKTFVDYMKDVYTPYSMQQEPSESKEDEKKNDDTSLQDSASEEYELIKYYVAKARKMMRALEKSVRDLNTQNNKPENTRNMNMPTRTTADMFLDFVYGESGESDGCNLRNSLKDAMKKIIDFSHYELILSMSDIVQGNEYLLLGQIYSHELADIFDRLDVLFKNYCESYLKDHAHHEDRQT